MRHPHARYRCLHCHRHARLVVDQGPQRQLRCAVCACRRPFVREERRITATPWPPPAREDTA